MSARPCKQHQLSYCTSGGAAGTMWSLAVAHLIILIWQQALKLVTLQEKISR
jgi:hypothetical protein